MSLYERLVNEITNDIIKTQLETMWRFYECLNLENIIDEVLIDKELVDKAWFNVCKFQPYMNKTFKYHINYGNNRTIKKLTR